MERPSPAQPLDPEIRALYALRRGETRLGLAATRRLMRLLGNPERGTPMLHVAGTNGKGSTTVLAAAMLQAGGLRVGRFTSPHVLRVEERICIGAQPIDGDTFRRRVRDILPSVERAGASFFEAMTALAALYFRDAGIDVAVYEVGLGGRLDATNVIASNVTVITSIGNDHESILGRGLRAVCGEKLGIVKRGVPLFAALDRPDLVRLAREVCAAHRAPFTRLPADAGRSVAFTPEAGMECELRFPRPLRLHTRLVGAHQVRNIALAAAATLEMQARGAVDRAPDVVRGAAQAFIPGRFQWLAPVPGGSPVVLDVGHNPQALAATLDLAEPLFAKSRPVVVLGLLKDKRLGAGAERLARFATEIVLTAPAVDRTWDPRRNVAQFPAGRGLARVRVVPRVPDALAAALESAPRPVLVLGSHYLLAEAVPVLAARRGVAPEVLLYGMPVEALRAAG